MATWVDPIDSQTDPDAPLTSELGKRWDNNVIAAFEGASGAPRLVYSAGEVGSFAFAYHTGVVDYSYGDVVDGADLRPVSAIRRRELNFTGDYNMDSGSALSGSWQCLGFFDYRNGDSGDPERFVYGATMWQRVS